MLKIEPSTLEMVTISLVLYALTFLTLEIANAAEPKPVVLTPTALYDLIERVEKKNDARAEKTLKALLNANQRIQQLEKRVSMLEVKR